jgi:hypothetical protein
MNKICAGVLIVMTLVSSAFGNETDWNLKKDKKGVQVYVQKPTDSDFFAFKAVSIVNTNMNSLVNLMRDMGAMENWLETCRDPNVIGEPDQASRIIHMKNDSPFPVIIKNRDLVLLQRFRRVDENSLIVDLVDKGDMVAHVDGYVRGEFNGHWKFTTIDEDKVEVEYQGLTNPEGSVPASLANLVVVDVPYKTLIKIRKILHKKSTQYNTAYSVSSL